MKGDAVAPVIDVVLRMRPRTRSPIIGDPDEARAAFYLPAGAAWRSVGILLFLYAVAMLDRQIVILMADPIRRSLHVGDFQIGLLHGLAFVLFYATCAIPLGWAVNKRRSGTP